MQRACRSSGGTASVQRNQVFFLVYARTLLDYRHVSSAAGCCSFLAARLYRLEWSWSVLLIADQQDVNDAQLPAR